MNRKVALFCPHKVMLNSEEEPPRFDPQAAERCWQEGYLVMVGAYEATPRHGFTVDKLLAGDYETELTRFAEELRQFGKPMFFSTAREPNGVLGIYLGGFGPDGTEPGHWAGQNGKGLAEFDPSKFPNPELYAGLGDPRKCDGLERMAAAQRYYHDFFVRREGLGFLTFDSMGWAALYDLNPEDPSEAGSHEKLLAESCRSFETVYPGDAYVDWLSITWYMWSDGDGPIIPIEKHLSNLDRLMTTIRKVAPGKPVLIAELGFPDPDPTVSAEKVTRGLTAILEKYPEINAAALWSESGGGTIEVDPFLIQPGTPQGDAFKAIVDAHPDRFHSCAFFTDGSGIPGCTSAPNPAPGPAPDPTPEPEPEPGPDAGPGPVPGPDGQPCSVGEEQGVRCSSQERCSTGEWVQGCCIMGSCS